MTTIAWKDGIMAADSQMTINNYKTSTIKLYGLADVGVLGIAGAGSAMSRIMDWWLGGCEGDPPTLSPEDREMGSACTGLLCTRKGVFYLEDGIYPHQITAAYASIGSGSDFAVAVMANGGSAVEAIDSAKLHDIYTGGETVSLVCEDYFLKSKRTKGKKK